MTRIMWPLVAVMLVQAMLMVATVTVPVLAPALELDTGIESRWIGVYASLVFAGALVSIILGGPLARRFWRSHHEPNCAGDIWPSHSGNCRRQLVGDRYLCSCRRFWIRIGNSGGESNIGKNCPAWAPRHHFFFKTEYGLSRRANSRPYSANFSGRFRMAPGNIGHRTSGNRGVHADPPITSLSG